jgi:hypothetical protein
MMVRLRSKALLASVLGASIVMLAARHADACAVCFGDPSSPLTKAMGSGILLLLGCIATVLGGFASMFVYWMVRAKRLRLANEGATR